jgi:hypothetical protein
MHTFSLLVLPQMRDKAGNLVSQPTGPDLSTCNWGIFRRKLTGPLESMEDASTEHEAQEKVRALAERIGTHIEPYSWAPTKLLTACAVALRTAYGYDLYDAGVESEADLHRLGITDVVQAPQFAMAFGEKYGLQRIDM